MRVSGFFAAILLGSVVLTACSGASGGDGPKTVERAGEPDIVYSETSDPAMVAAKAKAGKTLDTFWTAQASGDANLTDFVVKAGLETNDGSLEHIWVESLSRDGKNITGALANQPYNIKGDLNAGDMVTFKASDISDWSYWDGDKMRGHFTTRVLMKSMGEAEAAELMAMLHDDPLP